MKEVMNPIERIMKERNISSLSNLGIILNESTASLSHMKGGHYKKLSPVFLTKVKHLLGYDPGQIQNEYTRFRHQEAMKILEEAMR